MSGPSWTLSRVPRSGWGSWLCGVTSIYLTLFALVASRATIVSSLRKRDIPAATGPNTLKGKTMPLLDGYTRQELAKELGRSVSSLAKWASAGTGPRYRFLMGRVWYDRADVEAWLASMPTGGGNIAGVSQDKGAAE